MHPGKQQRHLARFQTLRHSCQMGRISELRMSGLKLQGLTQKHLARTEWESETARYPLQSLSPTIELKEYVGQTVHLVCKVSEGRLPTQRLDQNAARFGAVLILVRVLPTCEGAVKHPAYEK